MKTPGTQNKLLNSLIDLSHLALFSYLRFKIKMLIKVNFSKKTYDN